MIKSDCNCYLKCGNSLWTGSVVWPQITQRPPRRSGPVAPSSSAAGVTACVADSGLKHFRLRSMWITGGSWAALSPQGAHPLLEVVHGLLGRIDSAGPHPGSHAGNVLADFEKNKKKEWLSPSWNCPSPDVSADLAVPLPFVPCCVSS